MDAIRAIEILRSLADGRDPATGEQFPPNSPYQQADTVRALFTALEALEGPSNKPKAGMPRRSGEAAKAGGPWTPEEEQQLRDAFTAHQPIPELATAHGRTPGAITARLVKLGLIDPSAADHPGMPRRSGSPPPSPTRHGEASERPVRSSLGEGGSRVPSDSSAPRPTPPAMPPDLSQEEKDSLPF